MDATDFTIKDDRIVVRLTEDERGVLILMIDAAIRARGLEAAESGFILATRIRDAKPPQEVGG